MLIYEKPPEEELEVVKFWVNAKRRPWPTDEGGHPIDPTTGEPFLLNDDGLPDLSTGDDDTKYDESQVPERLQFWLQMLLGKDSNEIASAGIKIKRQAGRRRRRGQSLETDVEVNVMTTMKLLRGIVKWEGIETSPGVPAEITERNIGLLPGWIQDDLADIVSEISSLSVDEEGES